MSLTAALRRPARRNRLRAVAIALPLTAGLVLSGCSAGQIAQTVEKRPGVEGAHAKIDKLQINNAYFQAPGDADKYEAGDTVGLAMVVTNEGPADKITDITVDGEAAKIAAAGSSSTASSSATSIEIPASGMVTVGSSGDYTVEIDYTVDFTIKSEAYPSTLLPVTITFANAGDLKFDIPIAAPHKEVPRDPEQAYTPAPEGEH